MTRIGVFLDAADALLVHLRKDPLFEITIPSKIQAYMAIGKPLLAAVAGDAADLVRIAKCGVIAEPGDPESIATAAEELAARDAQELMSLGDAATRFYAEQLCLTKGVQAFGAILSRLATRSDTR